MVDGGDYQLVTHFTHLFNATFRTIFLIIFYCQVFSKSNCHLLYIIYNV